MMIRVKELLRCSFGRLACNRSDRSETVVASAAAGSEKIVGAAMPLGEGKDNAPPEWVRLIPPGTFTCNDGRGPFHNPSPDQVIASTIEALVGREAVADYDHATEYTDRTGQPAIAAGWVKEWRVQDGAVEGRVEWTALAAQRIRDREYRYLSPVFDADRQTRRVMRVHRFALTNNPSINELSAIAASSQHTKENDLDLLTLIASALAMPNATAEQVVAAVTTMKQRLDKVVASAGLPADASTETIVASLRDKPDTTKWIAASEHTRVSTELAEANQQLATVKKAQLNSEIETLVASAMKAGKVTKGGQQYWTDTCIAASSTAPLTKFLETAPVVVPSGTERLADQPPEAITADTLTQEQREYCASIGADPKEFAANLQRIVASSNA